MLTNGQKALLKRGQREAGLEDAEYREALHTVTGATTSKDPSLGNLAFDRLMAYFEAIFWLRVQKGELQRRCKGPRVFSQPGYWRSKNNSRENSRDRYVGHHVDLAVEQLEQALQELGYGRHYLEAIRAKVTHGVTTPASLNHYRAALERTLASKTRQTTSESVPF